LECVSILVVIICLLCLAVTIVFVNVKAVPLAEYFVYNRLINLDNQSLTAHAEHHQLVVLLYRRHYVPL